MSISEHSTAALDALDLEALKIIPFVGPRPFESRHADYFYGRNDEIEQVYTQIISSPASAIYSPSGAGKSSLLNAGVVPRLRARERQVFGVGADDNAFTLIHASIRVSGKDRSDRSGNVYTRNALASLGAPADVKTLAGYLGSLTTPSLGKAHRLYPPRVLVFDQFEEIFTWAPKRWREREELFLDIQRAFREDWDNAKKGVPGPRLRILFSLREEFVPSLEPYRSMLPDEMRSEFRLEPLRSDAARDAILTPMRKAGFTISESVASALIGNLQDSDQDIGTTDLRTSDGEEFVEPVQLQVVCRKLCQDALNEKNSLGQVITETMVGTKSTVDIALGQYYDDCIAKAAAKAKVSITTIRSWFDKLITEDKTRALVHHSSVQDAIPVEAIEKLLSLYVIRQEQRGQVTWYELSHDRLIVPVWRSNEEWRNTDPSEQTREELKSRAKRLARKDSQALLSKDRLADVKKWQDSQAPGSVESDIVNLITQSELTVRTQETDEASGRLLIGLLILGGVVVLMLFGICFGAFEALKLRNQKMGQELIAAAQRQFAGRDYMGGLASATMALDDRTWLSRPGAWDPKASEELERIHDAIELLSRAIVVHNEGPDFSAVTLYPPVLSKDDPRLTLVTTTPSEICMWPLRKDKSHWTSDGARHCSPCVQPRVERASTLSTTRFGIGTGDVFAVCQGDSSARYTKWSHDGALGALRDDSETITDLAISDNGNVLVSQKDSSVPSYQIWKGGKSSAHDIFDPTASGSGPRAIRLSPDGSRYLALEEPGIVSVWDTSKGEQVGVIVDARLATPTDFQSGMLLASHYAIYTSVASTADPAVRLVRTTNTSKLGPARVTVWDIGQETSLGKSGGEGAGVQSQPAVGDGALLGMPRKDFFLNTNAAALVESGIARSSMTPYVVFAENKGTTAVRYAYYDIDVAPENLEDIYVSTPFDLEGCGYKQLHGSRFNGVGDLLSIEASATGKPGGELRLGDATTMLGVFDPHLCADTDAKTHLKFSTTIHLANISSVAIVWDPDQKPSALVTLGEGGVEFWPVELLSRKRMTASEETRSELFTNACSMIKTQPGWGAAWSDMCR